MPARSARTTSTTASTPSRSPVSAAGSTTAGRNMSPTRSDTATAKAANPASRNPGRPLPKAAADELLVAHHTPDNMTKQTRRKLRVRSRIKLNADGEPIYQQGDTARCRLHQDTFYGAIKQDGEIRYVIRKSLAQLQPTDIDKIIDDAVRDRVREAIDEVGFKTAMNTRSG